MCSMACAVARHCQSCAKAVERVTLPVPGCMFPAIVVSIIMCLSHYWIHMSRLEQLICHLVGSMASLTAYKLYCNNEAIGGVSARHCMWAVVRSSGALPKSVGNVSAFHECREAQGDSTSAQDLCCKILISDAAVLAQLCSQSLQDMTPHDEQINDLTNAVVGHTADWICMPKLWQVSCPKSKS